MTITFSKFAVNKIVREYGYPPVHQRYARLAMQRRGIWWKCARDAVAIVNAATAHANYEAGHVLTDDEQAELNPCQE
jgi:hypothetical protein